MKSNPQMFATEFAKNIGLERAAIVAQQNMEDTAPDKWANLPIGPVFYEEAYTKSGEKFWAPMAKELGKTYRFWQNVYYILSKRLKISKGQIKNETTR